MTATMLARRMTAALVAVINLAFVTACGGSDGGPASPVVVTPPPAPVLTSFAVAVDSVITEGNASPVRFSCAYDGGASYDCTAEVQSWSAESPLEKRGTTVVGMTPGVGKVSASFKGKTAEVSVRVKPDGTPWSQLPAVTPEEKIFLVADLAMSGGRVNIWVDTIRIWADKGYKAEDVQKTIKFWRDSVPEIPPMMVVDSATANMRAFSDSSFVDPKHCGTAGPTRIEQGIIKAGEIRMATNRPECAGIKPFAHGLGHGMGTLAHTDQNPPDIMGGSLMSLRWSTVLLGTVRWKYNRTPNTKPID